MEKFAKKKIIHSYNLSTHHAITSLYVFMCIITSAMHLLLRPITPQ